jgi:hypothetical protein
MAESVTLKAWQLAVAVVAGVAVIVGGVGIFAFQSYTQAQISAATAAQSAIEFGEQRIEETSGLIDELELAIRNSEESLVNTVGQTLDEQDREALLAEIETSRDIWVEQKTKLLELEAAVKALKTQLALETPPKEALVLLAERITELANLDWSPSATQIIALGEKINSLKTAQLAWQKEMTRLADEEAAAQAKEAADRLAQAKTIAATGTLTDSGGSTAPSAPAPPPVGQEILVAPIEGDETNLSFITSYVAGLAPNSFISWVENLCNGYYVCGRAWVGGVNTTPVKIELDPALEEIYVNSVGISVLVHEAAHARQWLKYGSNIIPANEAYTGLVGAPAVEKMADCATIVKLGYSTNVYTSSCTPSELEAAATIW